MSAIGPTAAQDGRSILVPLVVSMAFILFCIRGQGPVSMGACEQPEIPSLPPSLLVLPCLCLKDLDLHGPKPCALCPQEALEHLVAAAGGRGECPSFMGRVVGIQQAVVSLGVLR